MAHLLPSAVVLGPSFIGSFFDEFRQIITFNFSLSRLALPMLTLIGAWGGFPPPPKIFEGLAKWRPFQYFFLWVLVMQGGASVDPGLSLLSVLIFVAITEVINLIEAATGMNKQKFKKRTAPRGTTPCGPIDSKYP